MSLMRSISGIRGIVGNSLTPEVLLNHTKAFLDLIKAKKIVIGKDSRPTGDAITEFITGICRLSGVSVINAGLATTPTVELLVEKFGADGGIIITASHNPVEWNALKFLNAKGMFLGPKEAAELFALADSQKFLWQDYSNIGKCETLQNADAVHIDALLALPIIDVNAIRERKFSVAIDAVNGAGSYALPSLLEKLNCTVHKIYCEPNGKFPRGAEPLPENLNDLGKLVCERKCDVGFALDPDADRCALVSEKGIAIGEEYTLAIAAEAILEKSAKPVCINLSTSRMCADIAEKFGVQCYRSNVGEINVSLKMIETDCIVGGEGNGGVILPALHYGRDSLVAAALVLNSLAKHKSSISDWVNSHAAYSMPKKKFAIKGNVADILKKAEQEFSGWTVNKDDGLWLGKDKMFVHVRASNTEPIIRVIAEAESRERAEELCSRIEKLISPLRH